MLLCSRGFYIRIFDVKMLTVKTFRFNFFEECSYLVFDEAGDCAIIDPGCISEEEFSRLYSFIHEKHLLLRAVLLTHAHFDHIYGVARILKDFENMPVYMSSEDKVILDNNSVIASSFGMPVPDVNFDTVNIADSEEIIIGNMKFTVITTPGHTTGGVCFLNNENKILFSGDTLFAGSIGRTDNEWGDYDKLIVSIMEKLMGLDGDIDVYPGHGNATDISTERTGNPFLQPFNEPDDPDLIVEE